MAIRSFKLDQLFTLLVPELIVVGAVFFPSESDFVMTFLSIWSHFAMLSPLRANPNP
jgi:hypothetical protein